MKNKSVELLEVRKSFLIFKRLLRNAISYTILLSIFFTGNGIFDIGFSVYWYYPIYILLLIYWGVAYHSINSKLIWVFLLILTHGLLLATINGEDRFPFILKQAANIVFSTLVFFFFIKYENYNLNEIFRKYVGIAKVVVWIGLIQVSFFLLGAGSLFVAVFSFETNITYKFQSLTNEPSFIAYTFAPVVFLSLFNLFKNKRYFFGKRWSCLFIFAYLLTFSAVAYVGLFLSLIVIYFHRFTFIKLAFAVVILSAILLLGFATYIMVPDIKMRIDDTVYGITRDFTNRRVYTSVNLSTYALLSNMHVARISLQERPLLGNGLGTHELVYDDMLPYHMQEYSKLNRTDANSLALRLLTETGWLGLIAFCYFLFRFYLKPKDCLLSSEVEMLWVLNNGILIMILLCLLRNGNYTIHGKLLFLLMYYFSYGFVHDSQSYGTKNRYV